MKNIHFLAKQTAGAVHHHSVLDVLSIFLLLFLPFQIAPMSHGRGKSQCSASLDRVILWNSGQGAYGNFSSKEQTLHPAWESAGAILKWVPLWDVWSQTLRWLKFNYLSCFEGPRSSENTKWDKKDWENKESLLVVVLGNCGCNLLWEGCRHKMLLVPWLGSDFLSKAGTADLLSCQNIFGRTNLVCNSPWISDLSWKLVQ